MTTVYQVAAYRRAARAIAQLPRPIEEVAAGGEKALRAIPGVGEAISKKIVEFVETGRMTAEEKAARRVPPGLVDLLRIPGLGPRGVAALWRCLGVKGIADLRRALEKGRVETLKGFGPAKAAKIRDGIARRETYAGRVLLSQALAAAETLAAALARVGLEAHACGSLRRRAATVGDIDLLVAAPARAARRAVEAFVSADGVEEVVARGPSKAVVRWCGAGADLQADLRVVEPAALGAALQHTTGSKAHNVRLRERAVRMNLKMNEYGVWRGRRRIAGRTEEEVYRALGLAWIPPELREDRGEIEAAADDALPDLLVEGDIRGDLHIHTDWSDGEATIEEMARAAAARGYAYAAITDHSASTRIAGGLSRADLGRHTAAVRRADGRHGIRLLAGAEVDIRPDGTLDYPDADLAALDWVIAAVHSNFGMKRDAMTRRVLRALENPHVDALAHPTGRLLLRREPYEIDSEAILAACARLGVAVEVNANPERLDADDAWCRRGRDLGVSFVIDTDAHRPASLADMGLGVATARRGWLQRRHVRNAGSHPALRRRRVG